MGFSPLLIYRNIESEGDRGVSFQKIVCLLVQFLVLVLFGMRFPIGFRNWGMLLCISALCVAHRSIMKQSLLHVRFYTLDFVLGFRYKVFQLADFFEFE